MDAREIGVLLTLVLRGSATPWGPKLFVVPPWLGLDVLRIGAKMMVREMRYLCDSQRAFVSGRTGCLLLIGP